MQLALRVYHEINVNAGMAVFDTMRYVKSNVSTVCVGLAASMGAFILASGHKVPCSIPTFAVPSAMVCCHAVHCCAVLWTCAV